MRLERTERLEQAGTSEAERLPERMGPGREAEKLPERAGPELEKTPEGKLEKGEYPSTYRERLDQTPREGERGSWTGERGESVFVPSDGEMKRLLAAGKLAGIAYRDGIPDFSPCAKATVEIGNMSGKRIANFQQCDQQCARLWSGEGRDGKTDWTARDVADWREKGGYTWHERNDMRTCDLVPRAVNDYFGHLGGVSECNKRDQGSGQKGVFDE